MNIDMKRLNVFYEPVLNMAILPPVFCSFCANLCIIV